MKPKQKGKTEKKGGRPKERKKEKKKKQRRGNIKSRSLELIGSGAESAQWGGIWFLVAKFPVD